MLHAGKAQKLVSDTVEEPAEVVTQDHVEEEQAHVPELEEDPNTHMADVATVADAAPPAKRGQSSLPLCTRAVSAHMFGNSVSA